MAGVPNLPALWKVSILTCDGDIKLSTLKSNTFATEREKATEARGEILGGAIARSFSRKAVLPI